MTNVPWFREMAVTSDFGWGKKLVREGGQVRWKHGVKIPLSRSQSKAKERVAEGGGEVSSHLAVSSETQQTCYGLSCSSFPCRGKPWEPLQGLGLSLLFLVLWAASSGGGRPGLTKKRAEGRFLL